MAAFGGFEPFPKRFGGAWTAQQHARMAADLVAAYRTLPFAIVGVRFDASSATIIYYQGRNGGGTLYQPTLSYSSGVVTLTWPSTYNTVRNRDVPIRIYGAQGSANGSAANSCKITGTSPNSVTMQMVDAANANTTGICFVRVRSDEPRVEIGHYGSSTQKRNDPFFGDVPAAYVWYQAIRDQRGTAYSTKEAHIQYAEDIATARVFAGIEQAAERMRRNSFPGTADERLGYWINVFGTTPRVDESEESVRRRLAIRYRGFLANSGSYIDNAIEETLGDGLVAIYRPRGADFDNPPYGSWHPAYTPGEQSINIFDTPEEGPKVSPVGSILIRLDLGYYGTVDNLLAVARVDLAELLGVLLPAHMTWRFGLNDPEEGFRLDIDSLDLNWLTEPEA